MSQKIPTPHFDRASCVAFCKATYTEKIRHSLVQEKKTNDRYFSLLCQDCRILVLTARKKRGHHPFVIEDFNIEANHRVPGADGAWCMSNCRTRPTIAAMSQSQSLQILINDDTALGKRKGTSTATKAMILALDGFAGASESSIKKAVEIHKISSAEHLQSYSLMHPYFEKWKAQDPRMCFDIEPKSSGVFRRLIVLMPNTVSFLPNLLNVFALDAGHMPHVKLKGIKENILRETLGLNHAVLEGREYIMEQLTLSVVTGLTLNHSRMLLGFCLGYGENHDDERAFLKFMLDNGCAVMNAPETVFMSDRGAVATPIDDVLPIAIHHFCPVHLKRNLQDLKYDKFIVDKFWAARCATNSNSYEKRMKEMEALSEKGRAAAAYLRAIPNWQVHLVVAKGVVLHELKSDNLVEGMFSSLREARLAASPVFVSTLVVLRAVRIQREAQVIADGCASDMTPRALQHLATCFVQDAKFHVEISSNHQAIVRYTGELRNKSPGHNVNLKKKTCDCQLWQQSGIPCVHAAAFIKKLHGTCFRREDFYEFCLTTRLKKMFEDYEAPTVVDLEALRESVSMMSPLPPKITPKTALIALSGTSSKRFGARSEKKGGGLSATEAVKRGKKKICPLCTKAVAVDNHRHEASAACARHAMKVQKGIFHSSGVDQVYLQELEHRSDESVCSDGSFLDEVADIFDFDIAMSH